MISDFDLHLESITGVGLPPPPLMDLDSALQLQARYVADFYASPRYDEWYRRTSEEMQHAPAFVWID